MCYLNGTILQRIQFMVDRKKLEEKFLAHSFTDFKWIGPQKIVKIGDGSIFFI